MYEPKIFFTFRVSRQSVRLQGVYRMNLKNDDKGTDSSHNLVKEHVTEDTEEDCQHHDLEAGCTRENCLCPQLCCMNL